MENNMFSGIFRGIKIKNREKSQFFTHLVEAAGVFSAYNPSKPILPHGAKSAKKRHFHPLNPTRAQVENFCFNFFRGFFGDFCPVNHPFTEGGCLQ